ncbi:hypothetical protein K1719_002159 [Acacia pycnantha]|nr:hypothetical protein K1719_002159 [Acacia pycnantha]
MTTYGCAVHSSQAYGMNEEFSRILSQPMEYYSNDPNADRINRLEGEMSQMKNGKEFLLTDTVGFIQKIPTTLVLCLQSYTGGDIRVIPFGACGRYQFSHPLSSNEIDLCGQSSVRTKCIFNSKIDGLEQGIVHSDSNILSFTWFGNVGLRLNILVSLASYRELIRLVIPENRKESEEREDVVCISALNGDVLLEFCNAVQEKLKVQNLSIT